MIEQVSRTGFHGDRVCGSRKSPAAFSQTPCPGTPTTLSTGPVKTDSVDAEILSHLLAADYMPGCGVADEDTHARRRQVARLPHLVRQRARLKNQVHAPDARDSAAQPGPRCPAANLFGRKGCAWLAEQEPPVNGRQAVAALLRQLELPRRGARTDRRQAWPRSALGCEATKRLMTINGVDVAMARGSGLVKRRTGRCRVLGSVGRAEGPEMTLPPTSAPHSPGYGQSRRSIRLRLPLLRRCARRTGVLMFAMAGSLALGVTAIILRGRARPEPGQQLDKHNSYGDVPAHWIRAVVA
jgi:hypothetical protein